jgi:hypothetical protein
MMSSPMDDAVKTAVLRLLEVLNNPLEAAILGPGGYVSSISAFDRRQGNAMRAALALQGQFGKIGKVLQRIHATYAEPLTLTQLATEAGMSVPTFIAISKR